MFDVVSKRSTASPTFSQQISLACASDILVTSILSSNVQNDRFISNILENSKHSDMQAIAYNVFAETVPSALLFSAAISSVVDYYADPRRKEELQKLVQLITTAKDATDGALMKFIDDALAGSPITCLWQSAHAQDVSPVSV